MRRRPITLLAPLAAIAAAALLAACAAGDGGSDGSGTVRVVAAFYPLAEAAERIGGDRVAVADLTPPGTEPHDIELTPGQVDELEAADVILYLGAGFQPAVEEVATRSDGAAIDFLEEKGLLASVADDEEQGGGLDPHIWLDPSFMVQIVDETRDALIDIDPGGADVYRAGASSFLDELGTLDDDYREGLANCQRDTIVTTHAAFGYLARRYGLVQEPIVGLSPDAEPDPGRVAELADDVAARGITTIFYETLVPPDIAETLAREANVTTAVLNPIEGLSDDELAAGADYVTVMRDNLAALELALGCT
jgi:zinc transport system substrate-binding protein